jgi:hypothetical protein
MLANYILITGEDLGVPPPYQVEMGAVGLRHMRLSLPQPVSARGEVSEPECDTECQNDGS